MKPTLFVLMLLMSAGTFAQISGGRKFLGGTLQFAATESNYYSKYREAGLSPYLGFVVNDKWAIGPIASYTYQRSTNDATPDFNSIYKRQTGTLGVFTRRYMPVSSNIFFFVHGQVSYGRTRQDSYSNSNGTELNTSTKSNLFQVGFRPGFTYFPTSKWSIDGTFGRLNYEHSSKTSSNNFNFDLGSFTLSITRFF